MFHELELLRLSLQESGLLQVRIVGSGLLTRLGLLEFTKINLRVGVAMGNQGFQGLLELLELGLICLELLGFELLCC